MSKGSKLTSRQRFWVEHLRQCAARGQSLSAYAAEQDLKVSSLYEAKAHNCAGAGCGRCLRRNLSAYKPCVRKRSTMRILPNA